MTSVITDDSIVMAVSVAAEIYPKLEGLLPESKFVALSMLFARCCDTIGNAGAGLRAAGEKDELLTTISSQLQHSQLTTALECTLVLLSQPTIAGTQNVQVRSHLVTCVE